MVSQVYLARAKQITDIDITKLKEVPMLVKCDNGEIYACTNQLGTNNVRISAALPSQANQPGSTLFAKLKFPKEYFCLPNEKGWRPNGAVKCIVNDGIVKYLQKAPYNHVHISKTHAHKDTRMDNRFFILKNERRSQVPDNARPDAKGELLGTEYYRYYQDLNGEYVFKKIDNPAVVLEGIDYKNIQEGKITQLKRNKDVIDRLKLAATGDADGANQHRSVELAEKFRKFTED